MNINSSIGWNKFLNKIENINKLFKTIQNKNRSLKHILILIEVYTEVLENVIS